MNAIDTLQATDSTAVKEEAEEQENTPPSGPVSHLVENMGSDEDANLIVDTVIENTPSEPSLSSNKEPGSLVQRRRDEKAQSTHWLAAGSKDGKISLWNIY